MTVKRIPTETELDKAYDYAMKKLCTEIPSKYGKPGLTRWNEREKVCLLYTSPSPRDDT